MASASKKESTNKLLRSLLLAEKNGFPMERLAGEYRGLVGEHIPLRDFGYNSLETYLRSIPEVVTIRRNPDGTLQCIGMADESTQHIKSLVTRQKSSKKTKRSRPKPMFRSRPRRAVRPAPVYRTPPSRPAAFPRPIFKSARPPPRQNPAPPPSYPTRPLASTYKSASSSKVQESAQRSTSATSKPVSKSSYNNQPQGFANRNGYSSKPVERTEPPRPKNTYNAPSPPPTAQSGSHSNQSAFVSVVSQDRHKSVPAARQPKSQQAPRVLAPRFLKQMQREIEEQKLKDMKKEKYRKEQAKNLATEHNNNITHAETRNELRITVANDLNEQDNNNDTVENSPVREEWPQRQVVRESGDWRTPAPEQRSTTPVSNSSSTEDHRSESPVNYTPNPHLPLAVATSTGSTGDDRSESPGADTPLCAWFRKELDCKNSGLWRSSLNVEYEKEFGKALSDDIIEKMENLRILTTEKVYNQEIVYPNLKVEASSNSTRRVVVNGSTNNPAGIQRQQSDSSGTASQIDRVTANQTPLQRKTSTSSDTSTSAPTTPTLQLVQTQSPMQSPTPTSPSPTLKSPLTIGRRDPSVPDYSHLAVPLPEEESFEVYVSYIKHLQDFYVLIVDEEYSDRLFTLEEEMGHYYRYSRRKLQGAPATGCMYAAELNKEWLRVMVDTVQDGYVNCFLVDHGDAERVESTKLQPLAPQFLHIPFQAIPCKLEGTEDDPENTEAVQKFCEVGLGHVLVAEVIAKDDAQVEIILYEEDAVATVNDLCLSCV